MNSILHILSGTWFIISTNFPMWLNGNKTNPSFNYSIAEKNGTSYLNDEVNYTKGGKTKSIKGFDHQKKENEKAFTWRGKGFLKIAKSNWEIRLLDPNNEWAVIWFSKTLFTPEGVDIISRNKHLDKKILEEIKSQMLSDDVLKDHVNSLVDLK